MLTQTFYSEVCVDDDSCRLYSVLLHVMGVSDRSDSACDGTSAKLAAQKNS